MKVDKLEQVEPRDLVDDLVDRSMLIISEAVDMASGPDRTVYHWTADSAVKDWTLRYVPRCPRIPRKVKKAIHHERDTPRTMRFWRRLARWGRDL